MSNLILAGSNEDRLASWKLGLIDFVDFVCTSLIIDKLDTLRAEVVRIKPQVLMLDFDLLVLTGSTGSNGVASLRRLCAETNTIIMNSGISEDLEWELLKAGVRGYCQYDIEPKYLKQAVSAVQQGELWVRRTLTCRLIDELGKTTSKNKAYRATLGLLNKLTQREYDIAVRVGNGECNKLIAQACGITERTVKAHLTEIYQKLDVSDRLNLALVLSADNRSSPINSDSPLHGGSRVNDNNS
jgi:DNA-binding NarL/FixJ family response regulator